MTTPFSATPAGLNEVCVGRGKLEASSSARFNPADVLAEQRRRFARHLAAEEVKLDPPVGVVVSDGQELLTHFGTAAELFENLAAQARGLGFSSLALAAGKLPQPSRWVPRSRRVTR